jgi:hypothetical protein
MTVSLIITHAYRIYAIHKLLIYSSTPPKVHILSSSKMLSLVEEDRWL